MRITSVSTSSPVTLSFRHGVKSSMQTDINPKSILLVQHKKYFSALKIQFFGKKECQTRPNKKRKPDFYFLCSFLKNYQNYESKLLHFHRSLLHIRQPHQLLIRIHKPSRLFLWFCQSRFHCQIYFISDRKVLITTKQI